MDNFTISGLSGRPLNWPYSARIFIGFCIAALNTAMNTQRNALKTANFDWLSTHADANSYAVTLTLKPKRRVITEKGTYWERLTEIEARNNFHFFLLRLNHNIFGKAAKRYGKTVSALPVLEGDGRHTLLHYHCALGNFPSHVPLYAIAPLITSAWHQTPFGNEHVCVKPMHSQNWVGYMTKEIGTSNTDVVDVQNLRLPPTSLA
jgi:hypothetical protein